MSAGIEVVNPLARVTSGSEGEGVSVRGVGDIEGLRIGLLDNGMPHAGEFLQYIGGAFEKQHNATTILRRKPYSARSAGTELLDEIASSCDVAVTGFGV